MAAVHGRKSSAIAGGGMSRTDNLYYVNRVQTRSRD
jgi:hypothetical protein